MPVPFLFDRGVSFRGDLSYFDLQQKLTDDDIMIKDYLGIGEQSSFIIEQLELNVNQINKNEQDIDYNFQYLHGDPEYSEEFSESDSYTKGEYVTLNTYVDGIPSGNEYAAIGNITAGVFNADDWREISTTANYEYIVEVDEREKENFEYLNGKEKQPEYDDSSSYVLYDVVSYLNRVYCCLSPTTGLFDPLAWQLLGVSVTGKRLELFINTAIDAFQFSAYGGLYLDSAPSAFPDIDSTYQTLDCFDTNSFAAPRNITQNVSNSSIAFTDLGVYEVNLSLVFSHDESNAGRTIYIRLYNLTDSQVIDVNIPIFIARNQPGTNFSYSFPVEFSDVLNLNKEVIAQVGGGDDVASVSFETAELYVKSIGEYRTAFPTTN